MSRYFTAPKAKRPSAEYFYDVESFRHIPTVSDHEATDTGLLDASGDTIWRAPEPMGFHIPEPDMRATNKGYE
jgi:hypothetical protein